MTADRIHIRDLLVRCVVGVRSEERRDRQDVLVNVVLHVQPRRPSADQLEATVDYRAVTKRILRHAEQAAPLLVETLAEDIAALCLEDARVMAAQVSVEKPGALRFARSVGVEITRSREG